MKIAILILVSFILLSQILYIIDFHKKYPKYLKLFIVILHNVIILATSLILWMDFLPAWLSVLITFAAFFLSGLIIIKAQKNQEHYGHYDTNTTKKLPSNNSFL